MFPEKIFFPVKSGFCLRLKGSDALQIANNLATNDLPKLQDGACCETFITNVKGWVVAHGIIRKSQDLIELWGMHPDPQSIADHVDRYVIREDVAIELDSDNALFALCGPSEELAVGEGYEKVEYAAFGGDSFVWRTGDNGGSEPIRDQAWRAADETTAEVLRIRSGWPIQQTDFFEKTIPQELDRTEEAISFTKGCYLGQETIARLDALGKLQKKLCVLEMEGAVETNSAIMLEDQEVGRVSSATKLEGNNFALAILKRIAFETPKPLSCGELAVSIIAKK